MSKRGAEFQGGDERYGAYDGQQGAAMNSNVPQRATAAQLAARKIASAKSSARSARSSRANTPTANPFGGGQVQGVNPSQTMSFQPGSNDFTFNAGAGAPSAPSFGQNGSTATPSSSIFGATSTQQSQNGSNNSFGGAGTSFGNSMFGASNATQSQPNGFTSSSNMFGQTKASTPTFGGFGQTPSGGNAAASTPAFGGFGQKGDTANVFGGFGKDATQQNGATTGGSGNNSFGSTTSQSQQPSQNSFGGFGASQPQQNSQITASTSFGGFSQPQQNGTSSLFGSTKPTEAPKSTADVFKGFSSQNPSQTQAQPNGEKPSNIGSNSHAAQNSRPSNASNPFGQPNGDKPSLFGSTPPPPSTTPPQLGNSILSGLNAKAGEVKAGMFTQEKRESSAPKPAGSSLFQFGQQNGSTTAPTPKPSSLFDGNNQSQANGVKPNMFGSTANQADQQTPKPAVNPFTFGKPNTEAAAQQSASSSGFTFGKPPSDDTSMTTPGSTPQKPISFGQSQSSALSAPSNDASRASEEAHKTKTSLFNPSTSLFSPSTQQSEKAPPPAASGKSLFDRIDQPSKAQVTEPTTPGLSAWGKPAAPTPAPASTSQSSLFPSTASTHPQASSLSTSAATSAPRKSTMSEAISASERDTFKVLNEGLKAHLNSQNPLVDWTSILQFYLQQAAQIRNKPAPTFDSGASGVSDATARSHGSSSTPLAQQLAAARAPQSDDTTAPAQTNVFGSTRPSQDATPAKSFGSTNVFDAPNTAPHKARKRSADEDSRQPPATEKRARPTDSRSYAPLPNQASNASKLFQSLYEGGTKSTEASNNSRERADSPSFGPPAAMLEQAREDKQKTQSAASSGFKPSPSGFTPSAAASTGSSGFKPSSSGMPSFAAPSTGGGGFLAAFGQKASKQAETDKQKRKAEDFDSDEDNEAEWEAKDREEQEAKRKKIADAAKSATGFKLFGGNNAGSDAGKEKVAAGDASATRAAETPKPSGASLFDLSTPRNPPATEPAKPLFNLGSIAAVPKAPTSNLFGSINGASSQAPSAADKTEGEKELGTGDNTWKPETPIKFGGTSAASLSFTPATAPPKNPLFGNLFGPSGGDKAAASTSSSGLLNVPGAKPGLNFNFGGTTSLATSRATTPGVTTDGEGTSTVGEGDKADDDAAPPEEQVEDQTGLRDEEKEHEDLLFTLKIAKAQKWIEEKKDAESGEIKPGWSERGKGPLYILKHKTTGKKRVILKLPPFGKACMNFEPLNTRDYALASAKAVKGAFLDHFDKTDAEKGRLSSWLIQVGKPEDAKEIQRILNDD